MTRNLRAVFLESLDKHPSRLAWWLVLSVYLIALAWYRPWRKTNFIREDVIAYYSYVPAAFVHGDLSMYYCYGNPYYQDKVWGTTVREGMGPVQKYTMGMAVMYTPGFLLGHAHAKLGGWTADGYTRPYRMWLQITMIAYFFIGLYFLRRILLRHASERATALAIIALGLGTNIVYYTIADPGMPHASLFMLVTLFMWTTIRFFESPTWKHSTLLALTGALICLIRPNHLILWGIPALYGLGSVAGLRARWSFWRIHWLKMVSWGLIGAAVLSPQLLYWKHLTGDWLYYSYGDEGFFWGKPYLGKVLFSFRKGLFIYTPVMLLAVSGLFWLRKKATDWLFALPVVAGLTWYVLAAWWCWWYGGSYGLRAFIDIFPLLAIGMVLLFDALKVGEKLWRAVAVAGLVGLLCFLNVFQAYQYQRGLLHYDSMTAKAYFGIFGRVGAPEQLQEWLETPDYEAEMRNR